MENIENFLTNVKNRKAPGRALRGGCDILRRDPSSGVPYSGGWKPGGVRKIRQCFPRSADIASMVVREVKNPYTADPLPDISAKIAPPSIRDSLICCSSGW